MPTSALICAAVTHSLSPHAGRGGGGRRKGGMHGAGNSVGDIIS